MESEVLSVARDAWFQLRELWPYFLAGVALEAWIRTRGWHVQIRKTLTRHGGAAIVAATFLGVVSPLCACGILPLTVSLLLGGLPLAPAMSLLVASPLMSPAGYALAVKNLGAPLATAEVGAGIFRGVYAGLMTRLFERHGLGAGRLFRKRLPLGNFHDPDYPEESLRCSCGELPSKRVEARTGNPLAIFTAKMWEGAARAGKYILAGVLVQILVVRHVPDQWLDAFLTSAHPASVLGLALAVVPLHLTQITASTILYGLSGHQVSGAAKMVLLVGGPVTALPVLAAFLALFRPAVAFLYLGICVSGTLLVAGAYQWLAG